MKHHIGWIIVVGLIIIFCCQLTQAVELKGTSHDLSQDGNMMSICRSCHIPSSANDNLLSDSVNKSGSKMQEMLGLSSSLFCAQCHDGTVSERNIGNASNGSSMLESESQSSSGKTGENNHPVNINYPGGQEDFHSSPDLKLYGASQNQIKCNTCHDPHKAGNSSFLRQKEGLCTECHDK